MVSFQASKLYRLCRAYLALAQPRFYSFNHKLSILVVTHNRLKTLKKCLASIKENTASEFELIVWNNASTDGTAEWLDSVKTDWSLRVHHSKENVGCNAYARGFKTASGEYLVEFDDDCWQVPKAWDLKMLEAFKAEKRLAYLGANSPGDFIEKFDYTIKRYGNFSILYDGPIGGFLAMMPRKLYDLLGGFPELEGETYFFEDGMFQAKIRKDGRFKCGLLASVNVKHGIPLEAEGVEQLKQKVRVLEEKYWQPHQEAIEEIKKVIKEKEKIV